MVTATQLVKALQTFGLEPGEAGSANEQHEHDEALDEEDEEITVAGVKGLSLSENGKKEKGQGKGKGKAIEQDHTEEKGVTKNKNLRGLLRTSTHKVVLPDGNERVLTSWKMADYAYKRDPCPFPTRARGLFTEEVGGGEFKIVARGYDKFFNVDEVSWTKWETIPLHSSPPYELTLKSNGCIILIAALSPSHIIVTSKHSLGSKGAAIGGSSSSTGMSHSQRGEYWLEKHLEKVGKTKEDLATALWADNLTAVAELCDDTFEEHVLAYPANLTGLHLHGLNHNLPHLSTLPSASVTSFAKQWGFIPTSYSIFPSVVALRTYCKRVEEQDGIEDDDDPSKIIPVEGFVVRGKKKRSSKKDHDDDDDQGGTREGETFFWKVKYDEPYLMYREWREITRKLLASHAKGEPTNVKPGKLRNLESRVYLWWVDREIQRDLDGQKFEEWQYGRGIIKTREEFLQWRKGEEGRKVGKELMGDRNGHGPSEGVTGIEEKGEFTKTLIVPVAVPGSGKTSLSLSLAHLYGWGHTQSDDFLMKKSGPHFIKSVKELLLKHDVVIADKNNHIRKLRSDLLSLAASFAPTHRVRTIVLLWPLDSPSLARDQLHSLYSSRIIARGANHQTLRAGEGHESILWKFFGQWEAFDMSVGSDGEFDEVLEMNPEWERKEALIHVMKGLKGILGEGLEEKSTEEVDKALRAAEEYRPKVKKELSKEEKDKLETKKSAVRYYGVAIDANLEAFVREALASEEDRATFDRLLEKKRIEPNPHVTLVHEVELATPDEAFNKAKQALWDHYATLTKAAIEPPSGSAPIDLDIEVTLGPLIVWDDRCMSIEVSALVGKSKDVLMEMEGRHAHVTVGTLDSTVRPVEGKWLLEQWLKGEKESEKGGTINMKEVTVKVVKGRLRGLR